MSNDSRIRQLLTAGVLESAGEGDDLRLGTEFTADLDERRSRFESIDRDELKDQMIERGEPDRVVELANEAPEICALSLVLKEYLPGLADQDRVEIVCVLDQIQHDPSRIEGSPESFLPIHGERLPLLAPLYPRAIAYIWREECPPCESMKKRLDAVLRDSPEDIALFSVYGPHAAETLYERYSVEGGPTTLFLIDGEVDARLIGLHYREVIDNEITKLRELSADA